MPGGAITNRRLNKLEGAELAPGMNRPPNVIQLGVMIVAVAQTVLR
jgi:hypothetical protein